MERRSDRSMAEITTKKQEQSKGTSGVASQDRTVHGLTLFKWLFKSELFVA